MSKPGFGQILFCDKDSLATSPVNPLAMGFKAESKLNITPFKGIKESGGAEFRGMKNFKFEVESLQATMQMIKAFWGWLNCNVDIQIVSEKQSAAGAVDVWKFIGNYYAGLDFEVMLSNDKRSFKAIVERAMYQSQALTFIDGADSETAVTVAALTDAKGRDESLVRRPSFLALDAPSGTPIYSSLRDLPERSLSIKTKGTKVGDNTTEVDFLTFELTIKSKNASIAKLVTQMNRNQGSALIWKESNLSTFYDLFDFAPNTLLQSDEFENTDSERTITQKFTRDVNIYDVSWLFGAANGGDAADTTGVKGGTMKIGY